MKHTAFIVFVLIMLLAACNNTPSEKGTPDEALYLRRGDSVASFAQAMLLSNVSNAIQTRGVAGAVDFCSEKAIPLTDSAAALYGYAISRISNKNRNPGNALRTAADSLAWQQMNALIQDSAQKQKHFIMQAGNSITYYKAITIAMPTCLKCHGQPQTNISPEVLAVINQKYPADKATGYHAGELRGLWKIKMTK
ncbi:Tll0287-like domain-containing protein [Parafilimonas sp.]|uniref:Tll0287-like domain-containing protein n=1 Tax=Parafilimonas sp. TaxID=1969739 RepID=UPI003F81BF3C